MSPDTYTYSREFRLKLLACCLDVAWMAAHSTIILPEYFELDDERALAEALQQYFSRYGYIPDEIDILEMCGNEYSDTVKAVFSGAENWDLSLAKDSAIQFAKEQAAKIAILESVNDIKRGDLKKPLERIRSAMMVGEDIGNVGIDLKGDVNKWLTDSVYTLKTPTGLYHVDMVLGGGLAPGELGVVLAPPNRGKSMLLVNIGVGCAGPTSSLNVVHFTHEMSESVVAKRYGARLVFRFPKRDDITEYEYDFRSAVSDKLPGNIRIVHELAGAATVNTLRAKIQQLISSGFTPDVIIDDYPDLLAPTYRQSQRRFELAQIFRDMRALGTEFGCPVWTATQTNRSAVSKEVVTMMDLAEAFEKAAIADVILALCQTEEEEAHNLCRLYLAKVRDGKSRAMISAKYYTEQQAVITLGMTREE